MEKAKVIFSDNQKEKKIPTGIRMLLRRCCNAVLIMEEFDGSAEVDVSFVDDKQMQELNLKHRNIDSTTDVQSFPLGENGEYDQNPETGAKLLGDIVISIPRAYAQAEEYGHSFRREMAYLTAHSMLHLWGYDHEAGGIEAVRMREKEETVMEQLGLPRSSNYTLN